MIKWFAGFSLLFLLAGIGCSKNPGSAPRTDENRTSVGQDQETPSGAGMPMMKEDPRTIKSVEGILEEVGQTRLIVHTKKNVSLKFKRDDKTLVQPAGKILLPGMNVKIIIEHLPVGMRAEAIEIIKGIN